MGFVSVFQLPITSFRKLFLNIWACICECLLKVRILLCMRARVCAGERKKQRKKKCGRKKGDSWVECRLISSIGSHLRPKFFRLEMLIKWFTFCFLPRTRPCISTSMIKSFITDIQISYNVFGYVITFVYGNSKELGFSEDKILFIVFNILWPILNSAKNKKLQIKFDVHL